MASRTHVVRPATIADLEIAATTLASAFADDPLMAYLIGDRSDREKRLRRLYRAMLKVELAKAHHLVEVVDGCEAVAFWHEVDDWKTKPAESVRALPAAIRTFGRRLPTAIGLFDVIEKTHPTAPHRYLGFIGVHLDHQGSGFGGALLAAMTERLDTRGIPGYLESSNPRNNPLYARHGFGETGDIDLPAGVPVLTAMWRDPR